MTRPFPLVTAHSGCMGSPENGRAHIERALAEGADIVELDIRLAGDGTVLLCHDERVARPDGRSLLVRDHGSRELRAAAAAAGSELLELDQALDLLEAAGAVVNLDAKEPEAAFAAAARARDRSLEDAILFSGLDARGALAARERIPRFRYLLNADDLLPASGYGIDEIRAACRTAFECGACGLNLDWRSALAPLMDYARPRCVPVLLWTVDEAADMDRALDLAPYSITTNRPDLLRAAIAERAKGRRRP